MEDTLAYIWGYGLLCLMVFILIAVLLCKFVIYLIKCGVKNAIEETLYSTEFREQLRNDIIFSIISSKRQIDNNYHERPTE